jgi:hypothetical protein
MLKLPVKKFNVGVRGFEPPTSWSQTTHSNRAELHPENEEQSKITAVFVNVFSFINIINIGVKATKIHR